jgi:ADP-ribose pyrophosphatase YjhB (NUDIX family)
MSVPGSSGTAARTLLEQLIRERQQTFEEFAEYAETFAREHGEPGTLSVRHLQRLVTGRYTDGRPIAVRPATARLLQRIFDTGVDELLSPPSQTRAAQPLRVAVAVVVRDERVLLVCRRERETEGISWQFPAGVIKPGMSAEIVAVQETLDETRVHCRSVRNLGSRLHPVTRVLCDYVLCDYVTGDAKNGDLVENVDVIWAAKTTLIRFIPRDQIYSRVLDVLTYSEGAVPWAWQ